MRYIHSTYKIISIHIARLCFPNMHSTMTSNYNTYYNTLLGDTNHHAMIRPCCGLCTGYWTHTTDDVTSLYNDCALLCTAMQTRIWTVTMLWIMHWILNTYCLLFHSIINNCACYADMYMNCAWHATSSYATWCNNTMLQCYAMLCAIVGGCIGKFD